MAMSTLFMIPGRTSMNGRQPLYVDLASLPPEKLLTNHSQEQIAPQEQTVPLEEPLPNETAHSEALRQAVESSLQKGAESAEALHENSIGIGMTSGYFGSFAEGETLRDDIRVYYFELMRRINEAWWLQSKGNPPVARNASLTLLISREGKIVACELLQGSGNPSQDQLLLSAVKKAGPLPPLPRTYTGNLFTAPIRFVPPLNLMLPDFLKKPGRPHG